MSIILRAASAHRDGLGPDRSAKADRLRGRMPSGRVALCGLAALTFLCSAKPAAAYKLQPGDTVEISVAGFPELRQSVPVATDGTIDFPLLGTLEVAGLSPADLRRAVQTHLAHKIYRQRTSDGREILSVIQPDEVSATVTGYRPVYVSGDVAKPGELTFRPGITIRQAIALAGGFAVANLNAPNAYLDAASAKADFELLWADFTRAQVKVARLTSELNGDDTIHFPESADAPLPPEKLAQMRASETALLKARLTEYRRERDFLQASITQGDQQIAVLADQEKQEEEGAKADTADLQKLTDLLNRGQVISSRVVEARRALLLSSTRALQVTAQLLQLKKDKMESIRRLEHFDDDRRITLLKELQEATQALDDARMKREAAEEKLAYLSKMRSQLLLGGGRQPEIKVIREDDGTASQTVANEDFVLAPGDVVNVALRPQNATDMVAR